MAETTPSTAPSSEKTTAIKAAAAIATQIEEYKVLKDQIGVQLSSGTPVLTVAPVAILPGDTNNRLAALAADLYATQGDALNGALLAGIDAQIGSLTAQLNAQLAIINS